MQIFMIEHHTLVQTVVLLAAALVAGVLPMWFLWRAFRRAGLAEPIALLALAPGGFIIALGILAFSSWPAMERPAAPGRINRLA